MNSSFLSMVSKAPRKVSVGISRAMSLDPVGTLQDGGFESELILYGWEGRRFELWHRKSSVLRTA